MTNYNSEKFRITVNGTVATSDNALDLFTPGALVPLRDQNDYRAVSLWHDTPRATLPASFSLPDILPVTNQLDRGSCAAFGVLRSFTRSLVAAGLFGPNVDLCEEALYAEGRAQIGAICRDAGSDPRTNARILCELGAMPEAYATYRSKDMCWRPNSSDWSQAVVKGDRYYSVGNDINAIKQAIFAGFEPTICLTLMRNFVPDADGAIPIPDPGAGVWGNHLMTIKGYNDTTNVLEIRNQWGPSWGKRGTATIPQAVFGLPETRGGAWQDGSWIITAPQPPKPEPKPEPPTKTYFFEVWARNNTISYNKIGFGDFPDVNAYDDVVMGVKSVDPDGNQTLITDGWLSVKRPKLSGESPNQP